MGGAEDAEMVEPTERRCRIVVQQTDESSESFDGESKSLDPIYEGSSAESGTMLEEEKPSTLEEFVAAVLEADLHDNRRLKRNNIWEAHTHMKRWVLRPVLYPGMAAKRYWDRAVSISILFHLLANPLLLAFSDHLRTVLPTVLLVFCDLVFAVDMLLTFFTASEEYTGFHFDVKTVIKQPRLLAERYLANGFFTDLVGCVPYWWAFCYTADGDCVSRGLYGADEQLLAFDALMPCVLLLNCLRVLRIMRSPTERWLLFMDPEMQTGYQTLGRLFLLFLYLSHIAGCLYWYISVVELEFGLQQTPPRVTWRHPQDFLPPTSYAGYLPSFRALNLTTGHEPGTIDPSDGPAPPVDWVTCYLYLFVWGMLNISGVNILKPETTAQTGTMLVVVVCSIAANAVIIGSITNNIAQLDAFDNAERQKRWAITLHMRREGVPRMLQTAIHEYYDFIGGMGRTFHELLPSLPKGIAFELELYHKRDVFLKVPFFVDLKVPEIMGLVPKVSTEDMMPGLTFIREGYPSDGMYMISRGKVQIFCSGLDAPVAVRHPGDYVGESALVSDVTAKASCVTAEWSTLFLLRRKDFDALCLTFPEIQKVVYFHLKKHKKPPHMHEAKHKSKTMSSLTPALCKAVKSATAVADLAHRAREATRGRRGRAGASTDRDAKHGRGASALAPRPSKYQSDTHTLGA